MLPCKFRPQADDDEESDEGNFASEEFIPPIRATQSTITIVPFPKQGFFF
jgi:hypothetical protein